MADTILAVDDDPIVLKIVAKILRDQFHEVITASTLAEAKSQISSRAVSVVLADLLLPDGSGAEIITYSRRVDEHTPVIVLTSSAKPESVVEAIRQGAFDYLEKPIDRERLLSVLERALQQRRKLHEMGVSPIPVHVLVIDDDLVLLKVMSNWLAVLGMIIYQASHLVEAEQILSEAPIDLVIADVFLEEGSGLEVARRLRERGNPPLIVVTSARDTGTAINALREGVFDFLQKPLNREEFISSVLRARQFREATKEKFRLEREKEEYRVRLELLSAGLEAKVKEQVEEVLKVQSFVTSIYSSLPSGLLITDRNKVVTAVNPSAEKLLRCPADNLVGKLVADHSRVSAFASTITEVLRSGKTFADMEAEMTASSGPPRLLVYTVAPLVAVSNQEVLGTVTHFQDMTSRRSLENYKSQSERLVSLGMMAGGMAHEINNPLTVIVGWLEYVLEQHSLTKSVEDALRKCLHAGIRCGELVGSMLGLSRRTASKVTRLDIHTVLRRVIGLVEKQLTLHHVEFMSQFTATQPSIAGDERELEQLFLNLILNARDAMSHGGKLFLSTQNDGDELVVRVVDTGVGVPKERLPHLFIPFYTTKDVGQGTGLGLAICQAIVDRHHGRIDASSEMGRGTTITVGFPMVGSSAEPEQDETGPVPVLPPLKVVVVDDDLSILELCQEALKTWGHEVHAFSDPVQCLAWMHDNAVDLMILDVKMPLMDGVALYQKIQEIKPGTKSLFITGSVVGRSLENLKLTGKSLVKVLRKPFRIEQMGRMLANIFGAG